MCGCVCVSACVWACTCVHVFVCMHAGVHGHACVFLLAGNSLVKHLYFKDITQAAI